MIIPAQCRPENVMCAKVAIATIHTPMTLFHTETDRRIFVMEVQRAVAGPLVRMEPLFKKIWEGDPAATRALLCHSRGSEAPMACNNCVERGVSLRGCVVLRNEYNNRCSNCIVFDRRDCSLSTRYLIEPDNDYAPQRLEASGRNSRDMRRGRGRHQSPIDLTGGT